MLLDESYRLTYLAEGGAHVVYTIDGAAPPSPTEAPPSADGFYSPATPPPSELPPLASPTDAPTSLSGPRFLLRLPKAVPATDPATAPLSPAQRAAYCAQFPPHALLREEPATLAPDLWARLDAELRRMDAGGLRPAARRGVYLRRGSGTGAAPMPVTLVEDMRPRLGVDLTMIELKPKWLVPSASAPPGAKRCRTCAAGAMRGTAATASTPKGARQPAFCPLDLLSGDVARVTTAVQGLARGPAGPLDAPARAEAERRAAAFLVDCEALRVLRALQEEYRPRLGGDAGGTDPTTAWGMTLRDCALFVRVSSQADSLESGSRKTGLGADGLQVPLDASAAVEARFGDLECKSLAKAPHWRDAEAQLIDCGWYEGRPDATVEDSVQCALARP